MKHFFTAYILASFVMIPSSFAQTPNGDGQLSSATIKENLEKDKQAPKSDKELEKKKKKEEKELQKQKKKEEKEREKKRKKKEKEQKKQKKQEEKNLKKQEKEKKVAKGHDSQQTDAGTSPTTSPGQGFTLKPVVPVAPSPAAVGKDDKPDDVAPLPHQSDTRLKQLEEENRRLKEENQKLHAELARLYTSSFKQKWESKPFSEYDIKEFQRDTQQIMNMLSTMPNEVQSLSAGYDAYQKGHACLRHRFNKQAIRSIIGEVRKYRDNTPKTKAFEAKKNELAKLHTLLFDYEGTIELFQDLIKSVASQPGTQRGRKARKETIDLTFKDRNVVDPEYVEAINEIPWLREQLAAFKKELETGGTKVQDEILNLLAQ